MTYLGNGREKTSVIDYSAASPFNYDIKKFCAGEDADKCQHQVKQAKYFVLPNKSSMSNADQNVYNAQKKNVVL